MKTTKMSLANIQGKLSRAEMKQIMAGGSGGSTEACNCNSKDDCGTDSPYCVSGCEKGDTGKAGVCHTEAA